MKLPFFKGLLSGILAPILFVGAALAFIYKATGKVPLAMADEEADQVTIKLIEPDQVPEAWAPWRARLESFGAELQALGQEQVETELAV